MKRRNVKRIPTRKISSPKKFDKLMKGLGLNLNAAIIPAVSIGGLKLGMPIKKFNDELCFIEKGNYELVGPFEAIYRVGNDAIEIGVDVRNGKIFKIIVNKGYKGKLFNKIGIGMDVKKITNFDSRFHYVEAEGAILCDGVNGLRIDIPAIDPAPDLVLGMKIKSIVIYLPEIDTMDGQNGDW